MGWEGMDRRQFPRVMYPCLVKIETVNEPGNALLTHTENIGLGGLCVILKNEIKLFQVVNVEVDLLDLNEHIVAKGKIVWSVRRKAIEQLKPMSYDIGIEFTDIPKLAYERLKQNIKLLIDKGVQLSKPYI